MSKKNNNSGIGSRQGGSFGYLLNSKLRSTSSPTNQAHGERLNTDSNFKYKKAGYAIIFVFILRVIRAWNQTGQKHAGEQDIAKTVFPEHNVLLWVAVLATYLDIIQRLSRRAVPWASRAFSSAASFILGSIAFTYKVAFTTADAPELLKELPTLEYNALGESTLTAQARAVFFGIVVMMALTSFPLLHRESYGDERALATVEADQDRAFLAKESLDIAWPLHDLFTLFLITQSRATNVPLFLLFEAQHQLMDKIELSCTQISLTSILLQYTSFFAFGGSNAISSIDLSNAYNGVRGYNVNAVGLLTFCGNWAGPMWWTSSTALLLSSSKNTRQTQTWSHHLSLLTTFTASSTLSVMLACTTLRSHLFIWTVFSPKYLYVMAWSMAQHLCITVAFGSLVYWLASSHTEF